MRTFLAALLAVLTLGWDAHAQFHSVNAFGSYSVALGKRLEVTRAEAWGGGLELRISLFEHVKVGIIGGFEQFSIDQDSALERWNWRFWNERYKGIVRDNLASDSSLSAFLTPVQNMEVVPLLGVLTIDFTPMEGLSVRQSIGGGVLFYSRSLYLHEEWQKRFAAQNYTFGYDYRNFSQDKKGNPFLLMSRLELSYQLSDLLTIDASARYAFVLATPHKHGYDEFPFKDFLTVTAGISFLY